MLRSGIRNVYQKYVSIKRGVRTGYYKHV